MTSTPPPPLFRWVSLIFGAYWCHTLFCKFMDCVPFETVHKFTEKKLKGSLPMFLFSFCFFSLLLTELDSGILLSSLKQACIFSLNFSGEIFRRTGHLSRQLCKITDVLWPCFMYRKIISRTCVQSKMGQPSFCFSSWWLC